MVSKVVNIKLNLLQKNGVYTLFSILFSFIFSIMVKHLTSSFILCLLSFAVYAQDSAGIFQRIATNIKEYKLDTSEAPNDKITKKILQLRNLRGGFNINEAIDFKIEEDRQKKEVPKEELDKIAAFFNTGNGKRWLDNAVTWIYRQHFTYPELKRLVKFYRTSAGQKMAADFPIIMLKTLRAGEMIKEMHDKKK